MKTLFKYKMKTVLPAFIIGGIVLIAAAILSFVDWIEIEPYVITFKPFFMERITNNLKWLSVVLIPIAVSMGIVLTQEYGDRDKEDFFSSLPYTKKLRFMSCIFPGVIFFLGFGIILTAAVIISHSLSYGYFSEINMMSSDYEIIMKMDSAGNAVLYVAQIISSMLMLFFIAVFAGIVSRNKLIAVLIIAGICLFPAYVPAAFNKMTLSCFGIKMPLYDEIVNYSSLAVLLEDLEYYRLENELYIYMNYPVERTITSLTVIIVLGIISYVLAVKADRMSGKILINKICENIFIIIAGIYGACVVPMLRDMEEFKPGVVLAGMIVIFIIIEAALYKFVTGRGKYTYLNAGGADEK